MKFAFMEAEKATFPVRFMSRQFGVSASGFYASRGRPESAHAIRDRELTGKVKEAFREGRGAYGSPRIHAALVEDGEQVGRKRVARVMREAGVEVECKRRFVRTTDSKHGHPVAPNVLDRKFTTEKPDQVWVTDITYIQTDEGWLYLAAILDLFSRKVVGWAMDATMERTLVMSALRMALRQRAPGAGLMHHSDRGSQYASGDYRTALRDAHITCSMSRKGDCWDNAVAESFFATLKKELVHVVKFKTRSEAKTKIFEYIEVFYNRKRLHSAIGYKTPNAFELAYKPALMAA